MRLFVLAALAAGLAGCNPYDPNLPPAPFRCGSVEPVCPSGYTCSASSVCMENREGPDAPPIPSDGRCLDLVEPNDMLNQALILPVYDQQPSIELSGLTLCNPAGDDRDFFRISQPTLCGSPPNPGCPNLSALVSYDNTRFPAPIVQIQTATGQLAAMGGGTGMAGQVKAVLPNVNQGIWYVVVSAMPDASVDYYELLINGPP